MSFSGELDYGFSMMTITMPSGELAIQTLAMPAHTNANGDIFGGWLVSQMDLAGAVIAKQAAGGRVVTVAINSMSFHQPVHVGDLVCCYGKLLKTGSTSLTVSVDVWTKHQVTGVENHVTEGLFVYVAIDNDGKPRAVTVT